mmetsp:Transcript_66685/g.124552  ORF Transcript_66685/g.124552 Transcript_66685/m.124552 type:complete len:226 (-) Transcript_66685:15-692(-)
MLSLGTASERSSSKASLMIIQLAISPLSSHNESVNGLSCPARPGKSSSRSRSPSEEKLLKLLMGLATRSIGTPSLLRSAAPACSCTPPPMSGFISALLSKMVMFSKPASFLSARAVARPAGPAPMMATRGAAAKHLVLCRRALRRRSLAALHALSAEMPSNVKVHCPGFCNTLLLPAELLDSGRRATSAFAEPLWSVRDSVAVEMCCAIGSAAAMVAKRLILLAV